MKLVVPDASTLLKWVLPQADEDGTAQAVAIAEAALAGRIGLAVPTLWYYEAGNILMRRVPEYAEALLSKLHALLGPWTHHPDAAWQQAIVELMARHGVTFYDASYHALAMVSGGVMVTADERYLRKVGAGPYLMALSDWPLP